MDAEDRRMYTAAGVLVGGTLLAVSWTGLWSSQLVLYLGGIAIVGTVLFSLSQAAFVVTLRNQFAAESDDGLTGSNGIDSLWTDLQEFEQADPRDTELIWRESETHVTVLPMPPNDPLFYLCSIATPKEDTDEELHVVVETRTGYILHHVPIDDDYTFDREQPFQNVPVVQEYRVLLMMDVMERREVKDRLKQMAQGKLPGGYEVTATSEQTQEIADELTNSEQVGSPDFDDEGSDGSEAG